MNLIHYELPAPKITFISWKPRRWKEWGSKAGWKAVQTSCPHNDPFMYVQRMYRVMLEANSYNITTFQLFFHSYREWM